jgi:ABC-type molybdate transport system permease subunit
LFTKLNKTTIVVISAHARFISAIPILLLGWVFANSGRRCYLPIDVIAKLPLVLASTAGAP